MTAYDDSDSSLVIAIRAIQGEARAKAEQEYAPLRELAEWLITTDEVLVPLPIVTRAREALRRSAA